MTRHWCFEVLTRPKKNPRAGQQTTGTYLVRVDVLGVVGLA